MSAESTQGSTMTHSLIAKQPSVLCVHERDAVAHEEAERGGAHPQRRVGGHLEGRRRRGLHAAVPRQDGAQSRDDVEGRGEEHAPRPVSLRVRTGQDEMSGVEKVS